MSGLSEVIRWAPRGDGVYETVLTEEWFQGRGSFGGLVVGALLHAFTETLEAPDFSPRSLTVHFCSPGKAGPAQCRVKVEYRGRSGAQLTGCVVGDNQVIATGSAFFGLSRPSKMKWSTDERPQIAGPRTFSRAPWLPALPAFCKQIDYRYAFGTAPYGGGDEAVMGGWSRPAEGGVLDYPTLAALLDVWAPPALARISTFAPAATIDLTTHFLAPPPAEPDAFVLHHCTAPTMGGGYAETLGTAWSEDGTLLARTRQWVAIWGT
ncbi:MAG: thioesterase family protein [Myxococcota bacterium]|nr:thioesterase family protein [Myxococcota bacterium]